MRYVLAPISKQTNEKETSNVMALQQLSKETTAKRYAASVEIQNEHESTTTVSSWKRARTMLDEENQHDKKPLKAWFKKDTATTESHVYEGQDDNIMNLKPQSKAAERSASNTKATMQTTDDGVVFELSAKRKISVRKWRSSVLIDIREFYDDRGVTKPGKKGISLSTDQWKTLNSLAAVINQAVELTEDDSVDETSLSQVKGWISSDPKDRTIVFSLGGKRRLSVRFFRKAVLIDIREFYEDQANGGEWKPGKKGIALSKEQWNALQSMQRDIDDAITQV